MIRAETAVQKRAQLDQLARKVVGEILRCATAIAAESEGIERAAAGCASDAEIDSVRIECVKHAKCFRDFHRTVVGEHHAARADSDVRSLGGDSRDHDFGRGACECAGRVMLGDPVALVAETIGEAGELDRVAKRVGSGETGGDR